tara:strand:- start:6102 stop:6710 length:609 start_codon:yes stop_codon:yes gene_type:complete
MAYTQQIDLNSVLGGMEDEGRPTKQPKDIDFYDAPIPGQSWTDEPGQWAWERPARMSDPVEAFDFVIEKIEDNPPKKEEFKKLMWMGASIEAIVNTISFGGFTSGIWSADTAEIIKLPLSTYFMAVAEEEEIPATLYNIHPQDKEERGAISDETVFKVMKRMRPDNYQAVTEGLRLQQQDIEDIEREEFMSSMPKSFMDTEE